MKLVHGIALPDGDEHFTAHLESELLANGKPGYQSKKWKAALPLVPRLRHAIDVGAHVGLWTLPMAKAFEYVTSFEPMPDLFQCFEANTKGFGNISMSTLALGSTAGLVQMSPATGNSGNGRIDIDGAVTVEMKRLDEFGFDIVDFIKIDVEGYELEVIRGAEATIRETKPVMVVEQKPGNGSRYGNVDTAAIELLEGWGATVEWVRAGDFCLRWK